MLFGRVTLVVTALVFAGFGAAFLVATEPLGRAIEIDLSASGVARSDVRTMYGGMELGFAAVLLASAARRAFVPFGCLAGALVLGGMGVTRTVSAVAEGVADPVFYTFGLLELSGAAVCLLAYRAADRAGHAGPAGG
jgi:hypothetical protein